MDFAWQERWARVETLFPEVVDLEPAARGSYLDQTCSDDPELRDELERLLAAHDASGGFLGVLDPVAAGALLGGTDDDEALPEQIGAYRIVRRLGSGGMGVVYLAHDPRLDRPVALKLLKGGGGFRASSQTKLIDEARAASALDHPHIAAIYEAGETPDGQLFIAMAYCEGEALAERLARGPIAPDVAAELARQIADALGVAHERGIIHRDVKPANIIISEQGRARLVDFGIAKVSGREAAPGGGVPGTLAYMSPEQMAGAETDGKTDVWALGIVLYEMLTGQRPFRATTNSELIHGVQFTAPIPVRELSPEIPDALARIVERCMDKDPVARPANGAAVAGDLTDFLRDVRRVSPQPRRLQSVYGVAAIAAFVLLGVAGVFALRRGRSSGASERAGLVVLPFTPVALDTALARLGMELVVTLSSNLDGAGGLRVIDPIAVLGVDNRPTRADGAAADLNEARTVARRLGADQMIRGRLTRDGSGVRLDATVYAANDMSVLARASATGPLDNITALSDSMTLGLLRTSWVGRGGASINPAAITTSSVPAMRAYLHGEMSIAGAQFNAASQSFARAIALDSTFWFAYWRYMYARSYHSQPVDSVIRAAVVAHRTQFPEQDRLLVESRLESGQRRRLASLREITDRFPSYWPAWFELGDLLTHQGAFLGVSSDEALLVLKRTVDLNPHFVPAWEHLFWLSLLAHDGASSGRALQQMTALRIDTLTRGEWDLDRLDYYRYLDYLARSRGEPRAADSDLGARLIAREPESRNLEQHAVSLTNYGFFRAQLDLSRRVISKGARPNVLTAQMWGAALAWAGRGGWDSSFALARQYARTTVNPRGALWAFGLATTGAWLGTLHPDSAATLRGVAVRSESGRVPDGAAEIAWLDGILACARGDRTALAASRRVLGLSSAQSAPALDRSLSGFDAAMAGQRRDAGRALAALEWDNADAGWAFRNGAKHPFLVAIDRLAAGRWLLAAGDTAEAMRLLRIQESDLPANLHPLPLINVIVGTLAFPTFERIDSARGRATQARQDQALFRERVDLAPPALALGTHAICGIDAR